jgi:hypothetical protein
MIHIKLTSVQIGGWLRAWRGYRIPETRAACGTR